jgi:hypothetical protein
VANIITPVATLSYPFLATPQEDEKGKKKYSCALVFAPGTDLSALRKAALDAANAKWPGKVKIGKVEYTVSDALAKGKLRSPFRDDAEDKGYLKGSIFMNVRTEKKPGVVFNYVDQSTGKPALVPQDQIEELLYPGCLVRASVSAFAYDREGNIGVSFGLGNVQKVGEGERLDSRKAATDEFTADLAEEPGIDLAGLE